MTRQPRPFVWILHAINLVLLVGITAKGLLSWEHLPASIPIHFNYEGVPNRWTEKGPEFGLLFALPWLFTGLLYGIRATMPYFGRHPEKTNLPPRLKSLPPERIAPLFTALGDLFLFLATAVNLTLSSAVYGTLKVATGATDRMPAWTIRPWLFVIFGVAIASLIRLFVVMARLNREAK